MTVKKIIIEFIKTLSVDEIPNHVIGTNCPSFGQLMYGQLHSPDMYSRAWRILREDGKLLKENNLIIEEIKKQNSKEKHFKIRRNK